MASENSILKDKFGRKVTNLRVSVIDRCNLRCRYCITEESVDWVPKRNILSFEEIFRFIDVASDLGIKTIRITGGEPLIRPRVSSLINDINSIHGIETTSMTTNAVLLEQYLESLEEAQLKTINISLDTLNLYKFKKITRRNLFYTVLSNIFKAHRSSIKVKINCVALKGFNDDEIFDFVNFATSHDLTVRFIEFMPFNGNSWLKSAFLSSQVIMDRINKRYSLQPLPLLDSSQTSREYRIEGHLGKIGFISSVSQPFCKWCNRIRLTAEGNVRTCLHDNKEVNFRILLRNSTSDVELKKLLLSSVYNKQKGHINWIDPHLIWKIPLNDREMIRIGG